MDRNKMSLSVWTVLPGRACVRIFNAKFTVFGNAFERSKLFSCHKEVACFDSCLRSEARERVGTRVRMGAMVLCRSRYGSNAHKRLTTRQDSTQLKRDSVMTTHSRTQPPVIIVGSGLSGLSAAAYLALAGHAVTLFEKARTPGGRARTRQRNGFFFNQGAHAFRLHGPGERVLSELGVSSSGSPPQSSGAFALADGKVHPLPTEAASLLEIPFLTDAAKEELIRVFGRVKHLNTEELQERSLQEWLEQQVQHPQVCQVLLTRARISTYTHAPDLLSAGLALSLLTSQVLYLDGGWQTLVDGLRQKAQEAGARLITQARVETIEVAGEGYRVLLADGSHYEASAVLLATDPETASALIADGTHEALRRFAAQSIPACVACLDIALRRLPRAGNLVTLCMDRPLYYAVHSASAHLAPEGSALVHLMKYLRPGEAAELEANRQDLEALMDL